MYSISTRGTFIPDVLAVPQGADDTTLDIESRYVLIVRNDGKANYGFCYFDVTTLQCFVGAFTDDAM